MCDAPFVEPQNPTNARTTDGASCIPVFVIMDHLLGFAVTGHAKTRWTKGRFVDTSTMVTAHLPGCGRDATHQAALVFLSERLESRIRTTAIHNTSPVDGCCVCFCFLGRLPATCIKSESHVAKPLFSCCPPGGRCRPETDADGALGFKHGFKYVQLAAHIETSPLQG